MIVNCPICGKAYNKLSGGQKYCGSPVEHVCPICGKSYTTACGIKFIPPTCGAKSCRVKLRNIRCETTNLSRYGVKRPLQSEIWLKKSESVCQKRYGGNSSFSSETVIQKSRDTLIEKYGVDNARRIPGIEDKIKKTNQNKYGADYPMQTEKYKQLFRDIFKDKYGDSVYFRTEDYKQKTRETILQVYDVDIKEMSSVELGRVLVNIGSSLPLWLRSSVIISARAKELQTVFAHSNMSAELEYVVGNRRFDLYIKSKNLLIEVDGSYWHSISSTVKCPVSINYHYKKSSLAVSNGFNCIHIWDWDNLSDTVKCIADSNHIFMKPKSTPQLHWWSEVSGGIHIIDDGSLNFDAQISNGFLPIYDDGYEVIFD